MTPIEHKFLSFLMENGYYSIKPIRNQEYWAGLFNFMFTTAIIVGKMGDMTGYEDRWCYDSKQKAQKSLDDWDGIGEPDGWHRHPKTGRRRHDGIETINF